jgi:hypothetical protein
MGNGKNFLHDVILSCSQRRNVVRTLRLALRFYHIERNMEELRITNYELVIIWLGNPL